MANEKRMIDANECPCLNCDTKDYDCYTGHCEEFTRWRLSPVDAVPVAHGKWEITEDDYLSLVEMKCSVCGE